MAVLIALVTLTTAVAGWLLYEAATLSDAAKRRGQFFTLEASSLRDSGIQEYGYDWYDAYREWTELDLLARLAAEAGDSAAADRYRAIRDEMVRLTPFLRPPYFDPAGGSLPQANQRKADLYEVEAEILSERAADEYRRNDVLDSKEADYINQFGLLTLTLSLYGFAATATSRARWIFAGGGSITFLIGVVWLVTVATRPVPYLPEAAIEAYARGFEHQRKEEWRSALAAFDQALTIAPDYASALYQRAQTHDELGDYEAAARDVAASIDAGNPSPFARWNLGWWNYLTARYDEAIETNRALIEARPRLFEVRANLGLALLAAGRVAEAQAEYQRLMDHTVREVASADAGGEAPPSSLWIALRHAAEDIQNLLDRQAGREHPWTWAPPAEAIRLDPAGRALAAELATTLKEFGVALEYTRQPPAGEVAARLSPLAFLSAPDGTPAANNTFSEGTTSIDIAFDYDGMRDGQYIVVKFSRNGQEDPVLRTMTIWHRGTSGTTRLPLRAPYGLETGEYEVEIYVDSRLAQSGHFRILKALH